MILVIDIGNTNIVFGVFKQDVLITEFRLETSLHKNPAACGLALKNHFLEKNMVASGIQKQIISSVVPDATQAIEVICFHLFGHKPLRASKENFHLLPLTINNPNQIGTDLVANALYAWETYRQDTIVVDFGTALTFTAINAHAHIKGVNIAPGIKTAMKALSGNTAQLPEIPLELPKNVIGTDTVSAMQAGIMIGYTGLVKYMLSTMKSVMASSCKVTATGGLSSVMHDLHHEFDSIDKHLTLKGILFMVKYIEK